MSATVRLLWSGWPALLAVVAGSLLAGMALAAGIHQVTQRNRSFDVGAITIKAADTVRFTNDDQFLHQIYVAVPGFVFDSAEQPPGQVIDLRFPAPGDYVVRCHIHPKMRLVVHVQ